MKIIIIFIFIFIFLSSCGLYEKNIENEKKETDNEIRLKCVKNIEINNLKNKIEKDKIKILFIDNVLCGKEYNNYTFNTIEDSIFGLKIDKLVFLVGGKYLDNLEDILDKTKIRNINIGICEKVGNEIKIEHKDGKIYCGVE